MRFAAHSAIALAGQGRYASWPYERKLETKTGAVTLKVPKLRSLPFKTAIIQRYRRKESSVEETPVEMYL